MKSKAILLALLCGAVACSPDMSDERATTNDDVTGSGAQVTGTLMYRERMALPPGSVAEVWLLDTSRADVPAVEISYQRIEEPGNPPIPFVLDYDPAEIREGMQYGVRATIKREDQLMFTSDTHYPVLTRGAGNTAEVMLVRVSRAPGTPGTPLADTYWKLTSIGADAYNHEGEQAEPHLKFDAESGTVSGQTGCNSFSGGYETSSTMSGAMLELGNLAVTMRACISGMEIERAYLDGLGAVNRYEISGNTLTLYAGDEPLLAFEAVQP
jgi:putative lipoprotein